MKTEFTLHFKNGSTLQISQEIFAEVTQAISSPYTYQKRITKLDDHGKPYLYINCEDISFVE